MFCEGKYISYITFICQEITSARKIGSMSFFTVVSLEDSLDISIKHLVVFIIFKVRKFELYIFLPLLPTN